MKGYKKNPYSDYAHLTLALGANLIALHSSQRPMH